MIMATLTAPSRSPGASCSSARAAAGRPQVASRVPQAGSFRSFGRRHLHSVGTVSAEPALSIHAYPPPLTTMRRYEMTGRGPVRAATDAAGQNW